MILEIDSTNNLKLDAKIVVTSLHKNTLQRLSFALPSYFEWNASIVKLMSDDADSKYIVIITDSASRLFF